GRVDQRHAQVDGAAEHANRLTVIARLTPYAGAGELHRAGAQTHHRQVAADGEFPTCASGLRRGSAHKALPGALVPCTGTFTRGHAANVVGCLARIMFATPIRSDESEPRYVCA